MDLLKKLNFVAGAREKDVEAEEAKKAKRRRQLLGPQKGAEEEEKSSTERATDSIRKAFGGK